MLSPGRTLVAAGVVVLESMAIPILALANGVTCQDDEFSLMGGGCVLSVTAPTASKPNSGGGKGIATHAGRGSSAAGCTARDGSSVPCTSKSGYWSSERQCYVKLLSPQPPAGDPLWEGHSDGAVYSCSFDQDPMSPGIAHQFAFWSPQQPAGVAAPPDPAVLARTAVERMGLRAIEIGMVPEDRPGVSATVGMPVWMWVDRASPQTFGPQTQSVSERGVSVTATARVSKVLWEMGDGEAVTCRSKGTVFTVGNGGEPSPDCGYTYQQRGVYTVRATNFWTVEWTSSTGQSGQIPLDFTASRVLEVGEVQVVRR